MSNNFFKSFDDAKITILVNNDIGYEGKGNNIKKHIVKKQHITLALNRVLLHQIHWLTSLWPPPDITKTLTIKSIVETQ